MIPWLPRLISKRTTTVVMNSAAGTVIQIPLRPSSADNAKDRGMTNRKPRRQEIRKARPGLSTALK